MNSVGPVIGVYCIIYPLIGVHRGDTREHLLHIIVLISEESEYVPTRGNVRVYCLSGQFWRGIFFNG